MLHSEDEEDNIQINTLNNLLLHNNTKLLNTANCILYTTVVFTIIITAIIIFVYFYILR